MISPDNLIQTLKERSVLTAKGITFISGSDQEEFLSYNELYNRALLGLGHLQQLQIARQSEVVLQIENTREFIISFWACILGGFIPVPLSVGKNDEHKKKLLGVWKQLKNPYLLGEKNTLETIRHISQKGYSDSFDQIEPSFILKDQLFDSKTNGVCVEASEDDIVFIQFSSGSTGTPKGIVLTHRNLLSNIRAIGSRGEYHSEDILMSWMPLTHDMGLIGFHLCPVYEGVHHLIMDTNLFIRRPALWMQKTSHHRASVLCSPNFGYRYILKHFDSELKSELDLSCIRLIYNGAEPISVNLCNEFLEYFADCGLQKQAMCPVYGLAEASLAVAMSVLSADVKSIIVDRNNLNVGDQIIRSNSSTDTISLVNVGTPVPDCTLRIVNEGGKVVPGDTIGHIHIKGKNVTAGYYNLSSDAIKLDGWLDTGDIGVLVDGDLHITGRSKDIIFVNGQNYYPHDIEQVAQKVDQVELNKIAVVNHIDASTQENEVIAFVFYRGKLSGFLPIVDRLKATVNRQVGLEINQVIPVKNIPRTTSGKLQRFKILKQYTSGQFEEVKRQLAELQSEEQGNDRIVQEFSDEVENRIKDIWLEVLKTPNITSSDNFLEIGGNSLKLAEVGMIIWREFQVELGLKSLMEHQTIPSLAAEVKKLGQTEYASIPVAENEVRYPLSSAQKRLFFAWRLNQDSLAYNNPVAFTIHGKVSPSDLNGAINILISENDALRMSFGFSNDPYFEISDPNEVYLPIEVVDCSKEELDKILEESIMPFDLHQAPLFRTKLLRVSEGDPILFLDFHHIAIDGLSILNLVEDLLTIFYGNHSVNKSIGFKDFVLWEADKVRSESFVLQREFWHRQFESSSPTLDLPTDFSRPPVFDPRGARIEFQLGEETANALRGLARRNDCTPFVLMLSLYKLLLFKYSGQDEVMVGVPVAGRNHPDLLKMYGMFVNNLAMRGHFTAEDSFSQFLGRTRTQVNEALENQEYPFETLINDLNLRTDASRNPIFDTMFNYQNMGMPASSGALKASRYFFNPGFSKFDLSIEFFDQGKGPLPYSFEYSTSLFKESTILKINELYRILISRILEDQQVRLRDLSLVSSNDYGAVIDDFNNTTRDYQKDKTIDQLFREQVQINPESIAIIHQEHQLTYEQLGVRVKAQAAFLRKQGVRPGVIVAIMMNRSINLVVNILAVMEAGGAYLPVDIDSPEARVKYILEDSKAHLLLTNLVLQNKVENFNITNEEGASLKIINIDHPNSECIQASDQEPEANTIDQLVYVIYTSGTTGHPKGVVVGHGSLTNYIQWAASQYVNKEKSNFPLFTNVAFDLTVTSIFTPLITGNSIVVFDEEPESALLKMVQSEAVNVIKLTPSHLRIIREIDDKQIASNSRVQRLIVGGEALETSLAEDIQHKLGKAITIYNEYGPTEATVGCMIHKFDADSISSTVPIGRPIDNTRIYVLDQYLNPVPMGVKGELYVSGDALAHGYLHREALTVERFIDNPFVSGLLMYKTGDLARFLPSGELEFISRVDDQMKIRGHRVELSEIVNCLKEIPGIDDALVVQKKADQGQLLLVGYYLGDPVVGPGSTEEEVIGGHLIKHLPEYMIPRHFIGMEAFPLTQNGKIDQSSLPAPTLQQDYLAPSTEMEKDLVEVWNDLFDREDIGIKDNFFDLGGDSIKAVQIASRLLERKIEVKARDIIAHHTILQIAQEAKEVVTEASYQQGILSGERGLTPIESWFFAQSFENINYYNQSVLLNFNHPIQVPVVNEAFRILIEHHDTLRTNYTPRKRACNYNNELIGSFECEVYDIASESKSLEEICIAIKQSIDITNGSLIRAGVINDTATHYLFITAHHLIIDGISWRVLLEDLKQVYQGLEKGEPPKLPAKTGSLLLWERELTEFKNKVSSTKNYWSHVNDVDFSLPQDHQVEKNLVADLQKKTLELDQERTHFLLTKAHERYKTDVLTLLTTALAFTLKQWTGKREFVIEFENHGRHLGAIDTSRTVGWFTTMYPMLLQLKEDTLTEQIKAVKEQLRKVPDGGISYGIQKFLDVEGENGVRTDLSSEIRFNYLGQFGKELNNELFSFSNRSTGLETDPGNSMTTKLELNLMVVDAVLRMEVNYNAKAFNESTITSFCQMFERKLTEILDHISEEKEVHFTPSDFDSVELDDDALAALFD